MASCLRHFHKLSIANGDGSRATSRNRKNYTRKDEIGDGKRRCSKRMVLDWVVRSIVRFQPFRMVIPTIVLSE